MSRALGRLFQLVEKMYQIMIKLRPSVVWTALNVSYGATPWAISRFLTSYLVLLLEVVWHISIYLDQFTQY